LKVTRAEIAELLRRWGAGKLAARDVRDWAQTRYWPGEVEFDDLEGDGSSAACEALAALDQLPMNVILSEDVPLYLAFLSTPVGKFESGYERLRSALDQIDYSARRRALSNDDFYGPFCRCEKPTEPGAAPDRGGL